MSTMSATCVSMSAAAVSAVMRVQSSVPRKASTSAASAQVHACACRRRHLHSHSRPHSHPQSAQSMTTTTTSAKHKHKQMRHLHRSILFHLYPAGAAFATAPGSPSKGTHFIPPKPNIQPTQGGSGPAWSSSHVPPPPPPPPPNSSSNQSQSGSNSGSSSSGGSSSNSSNGHQSNSHSHSSHSNSHSHSHSNSHTHDSSPLSSATAAAAASDASTSNPNTLTSSPSPDDETLLATLCTPATPLIDPTDPLMCQVANLYWEMRRLASAHMHNGHPSLPQVPDHLVALADQVWHHYLNVSAKQPGSIQSYTLTMLTETLDLLFVAAMGTRVSNGGGGGQRKRRAVPVRRPPPPPPVVTSPGMLDESTCGTPNPSSPHACPSSVASAYLSRLQYVLDECHDRRVPVPSQVYATILEHLLPTPPPASRSAVLPPKQQPMRAYHFLLATPPTAAIPAPALLSTFQSLLLANRVTEYFDTYHQHVLPHAHLHLSDKFAGQLLAAVVQAGHMKVAHWALRRMGQEARWRDRVHKVMSKAVRGVYWRGVGLEEEGEREVKEVAGKKGVETWVKQVEGRWAWALAMKPDDACLPEAVSDAPEGLHDWIHDACVGHARGGAPALGTYLSTVESLLPTHPAHAVDFVHQMHSILGHAPQPRFLAQVIDKLIDAGHIDLALSLATSPLTTTSPTTNAHLTNARLRALLAGNDLPAAVALFTGIPPLQRDAKMYTQVLHALARAGMSDAAESVFFDDLLLRRADVLRQSAAPATVMVGMYARDNADGAAAGWSTRDRERRVDEIVAQVSRADGLVDAYFVNAVLAAYARVGGAGKADAWIRGMFGLAIESGIHVPVRMPAPGKARDGSTRGVPDVVSATTAMLYHLRRRRWRNVVREYDAGLGAGASQGGWFKVLGVIGLMRCGMWERAAEVVGGMRFAGGEEGGWAVALAMTVHDMCNVGKDGGRRGGVVPDPRVVEGLVRKLLGEAAGDIGLAAYLVKPALVADCTPELARYIMSLLAGAGSDRSRLSRNAAHWLARFAAEAPGLDHATRMVVARKLLQLVPVHLAPSVVADYLYYDDQAGVEQVDALLAALPLTAGLEFPPQQDGDHEEENGVVDGYMRAWLRAVEAVHVRSDGCEEMGEKVERMASEAVRAVGAEWEGNRSGSEAAR